MRDDGLIILRNDESFWGLENALKVKTGRFVFWKFRDFEVVELSRVTYPEKIEKKVFLRWSYCKGWPTQVKNMKIFQSGEKCKDFSKWSYCNGRPALVESEKSFQSGEKCGDFSKWSCCNGWPAQMKFFWRWWEMRGFLKNGFIVMGNRPKWKILKVVRNARISQKMVSL